jgi:hypothetical protein
MQPRDLVPLLLVVLFASCSACGVEYKPLEYWPGRPVTEFIAERGEPGMALDQPDGGRVMVWSETDVRTRTLPDYTSTTIYGAGVKNTTVHPGPSISRAQTTFTTVWVKKDGTIEKTRMAVNKSGKRKK